MTHRRDESLETTPPMTITRDSKLKTNLATILGIVAAVWFASTQWNNTKHTGEELTRTVDDHTRQLTTLQTSVGAINDQVRTVKANQDAQLELLRYLARDRKGPVPEAAK